jgi:hypothetical protein
LLVLLCVVHKEDFQYYADFYVKRSNTILQKIYDSQKIISSCVTKNVN